MEYNKLPAHLLRARQNKTTQDSTRTEEGAHAPTANVPDHSSSGRSPSTPEIPVSPTSLSVLFSELRISSPDSSAPVQRSSAFDTNLDPVGRRDQIALKLLDNIDIRRKGCQQRLLHPSLDDIHSVEAEVAELDSALGGITRRASPVVIRKEAVKLALNDVRVRLNSCRTLFPAAGAAEIEQNPRPFDSCTLCFFITHQMYD